MTRAVQRLCLLTSVLALLSSTCARAARGEELPPWVQEIASRPEPSVPADADTVILLNDVLYDFAPDGRLTTRQRTVVRVLQHEGRAQAKAGVSYMRPGDKVRDFAAWLKNRDGSVRRFGRKDVVDLSAMGDDTLYSESRLALIDATREADAGSLFASESITEEPASLGQGGWTFQLPCPVAVSRCLIHVPDGWRVEGSMIHHDPVAPAATAAGLLWELRDLPGLKDEPFAPSVERRCAGLRFNIVSLPDAKGRTPLRTTSSWSDLVRFARDKFALALRPDPAVAAKARELCAGKTTQWDKIRAIGGFVQHLRYVSIAANMRKDGGIIPHPAAEVLHCGYGDCKDKTALLCAMLSSAGITGFPVLCFSGDRTAVQTDWPSSLQFNHMFAAIPVDATVASPFVIDDPTAGRLLLFDPTDEDTPIGDFPSYNQGGLVLVCTPEAERLTAVPHDPAAAYRVALHTTAIVAPSGSVEVELTETNQRGAAAKERSRRKQLAKDGKTAADWLKETLPGAVVQQAILQDATTDDSVTLTAKFALPKFGQAIRRDMLAVKPLVAWGMALPPLNGKTRTLPILLSATRNEIVAEFSIPDGYRVTDPGATIAIDRPFGHYEAQTVCEGSKAVFRRTLILRPTELAPDQYAELKSFFDTIRKRENTPIILEGR